MTTTRSFKLELNGKDILEVKASGDQKVVDYFFNTTLVENLGLLYKIQDTVAARAAQEIKHPSLEIKGSE